MPPSRRSRFPGLEDSTDRVAAGRRALVAELVRARQRSGLSQTEVAARMGTSQSAVARLESGELDARLATGEREPAALGRAGSWPERGGRGGGGAGGCPGWGGTGRQGGVPSPGRPDPGRTCHAPPPRPRPPAPRAAAPGAAVAARAFPAPAVAAELDPARAGPGVRV